MIVTIVGTGRLARGISIRALAGGHELVLVGTHISKADDLADELTALGSAAHVVAAAAPPAPMS